MVNDSIRAAFEYQGQKCSALSRLYVPASLWNNGGLKEKLLAQVKTITVGPVQEFKHLCGPVISKTSFDKITVSFASRLTAGLQVLTCHAPQSYIETAKNEGGQIIAGGKGDDSVGFFIEPTIVVTENPQSSTMVQEVFGPLLSVYVYDDSKAEFWRDICREVDTATSYGLTGAIFARDRQAVINATSWLRYAAGNAYVNCRCTGAVVGSQPFGGSRSSGTCDKAGYVDGIDSGSVRGVQGLFADVPRPCAGPSPSSTALSRLGSSRNLSLRCPRSSTPPTCSRSLDSQCQNTSSSPTLTTAALHSRACARWCVSP